jgi:iron(III) transport system substrate-binding protein
MALNAFTPFTVFINTELIPPNEEPKSFKDLLNPKWKGKISITQPEIYGNTYFLYVAFGPDGTNELSEDYWKAFGEQVVMIGDIAEAQQRVASGEFYICVEPDTQTQVTLLKAGSPVKAIEMSEGTIALTGAGFMMVDKAPHPNAALLFINWVLSKEGSLFFADERPQIPLRLDVTPTNPMPTAIVKTHYQKLVPFGDDQMRKVLEYKAAEYFKKLWAK